MALRRRYKIQDVIQRRQVLLVQVVKEERGNKGAALTTYLSLAGRYCVLMPNSSHGGGISRKISSASDRKRLKQIIAEMELPRSMSCIVRTAGLQRTKPESSATSTISPACGTRSAKARCARPPRR
jgi:ribonuclease E